MLKAWLENNEKMIKLLYVCEAFFTILRKLDKLSKEETQAVGFLPILHDQKSKTGEY